MIKFNTLLHVMYCIAGFALALPANAEVLLQENFDAQNGLNKSTKWQFKAPFTPTNPFGMMMAGNNDIYSIVTHPKARSGGKVLRLNFAGRNGFCNTCGAASHLPSATEAGNACIQVAGSPFGQYVYNRSKYWVRYDITSTNNGQVCFSQNNPSGAPLVGNTISVSAGDELRIPYQCGTNGVVGNDINRRNDCNLAINYLDNIQKNDFALGQTLSRRLYVYVDANVVEPSTAIKLGYSKFSSGSVIPVISFHRGATLEVDTWFNYLFIPLTFERGKWYYLEENFTRESAKGNDGTYTLYAGEENSAQLKTPLHVEQNVHYGDISALSIIGNWQHNNDAFGDLLLDDIQIAHGYIGPTNAGSTNPGPTTPPTNPVVRPNPPTGVNAVSNP